MNLCLEQAMKNAVKNEAKTKETEEKGFHQINMKKIEKTEIFAENSPKEKNIEKNSFFSEIPEDSPKEESPLNSPLTSEVLFTRIYLQKLLSIENGDTESFKRTNEELLGLYEQNHPLACHLIAKEIYKVAQSLATGKQKKSKSEMLSKAFELFSQAASKGSFQSFYYLGEMAQNGDVPGGVDLKYAFDCYLIAAANDSALAFFRLAQL